MKGEKTMEIELFTIIFLLMICLSFACGFVIGYTYCQWDKKGEKQ